MVYITALWIDSTSNAYTICPLPQHHHVWIFTSLHCGYIHKFIRGHLLYFQAVPGIFLTCLLQNNSKLLMPPTC